MAERAIEVWPYLKKYIEAVRKTKSEPKTASYCTLKEAISDPLMVAKVNCLFYFDS